MTDKTTYTHKFLIRIVYKSGYILENWFLKFDIKWAGGALTSIEWKSFGEHRILFMGMDEIQSIEKLKDEELAEPVPVVQ